MSRSSKKGQISSPDIVQSDAQTQGLPKHIAIIMDGNNRWAKKRGLRGAEGHKEGAKAVKETVKNCVRLGVEALTVFAFSSENWRRPTEEVELLMQLFLDALNSEVEELYENGVRLRFVGDLSSFSVELQKGMQDAMSHTQGNSRLTFNVAVNYGGRWDITAAARSIAHDVKSGQLDPEDIDEHLLDARMTLSDMPPVDLCIRTSGEQRISNFLLWQVAYSELYFAECLWPDFDFAQLKGAVEEFGTRQRRFGRTSEQLLEPLDN